MSESVSVPRSQVIELMSQWKQSIDKMTPIYMTKSIADLLKEIINSDLPNRGNQQQQQQPQRVGWTRTKILIIAFNDLESEFEKVKLELKTIRQIARYSSVLIQKWGSASALGPGQGQGQNNDKNTIRSLLSMLYYFKHTNDQTENPGFEKILLFDFWSYYQPEPEEYATLLRLLNFMRSNNDMFHFVNTDDAFYTTEIRKLFKALNFQLSPLSGGTVEDIIEEPGQKIISSPSLFSAASALQ